MEDRVKDLCEQAGKLFEKRAPLLSLWQDIADNFYPERADFTTSRNIGEEFASGLMTSYPLLARRDLGNAFSGMLRPTSKEWFKTGTTRMDRVDNAGKRWLEHATETQRRAMYDRHALFVRATKEADHDFAAFGQCVISTQLNRNADALLYRTWHLRDVAWCENEEGKVDTIFRKWKPYARELIKLFPQTVSKKVRDIAIKGPYEEIKVGHAVVPAYTWGGKYRTPYVSIFYEEDSKNILEEVGSYTTVYTIPRWQTVSGSQYAYSPATVAALSDARLIQAMTRVLLEAGEKAVTPPMLAVTEAIRGDISVYAGGITAIDSQYDERLGEVLRPLEMDRSGIPLGLNMQQDTREMIAQAFFLNKLSMPVDTGQMTAYEVGQRVQEYIRQALPIFEPMETDYNGELCEQTFEILYRAGTFGPMQDIPQSLSQADIQFTFESPLRDAIEAQKGTVLMQAKNLLAQVVDLDPSAALMFDAKTALRDSLEGIGVPAKWVNSVEDTEQAVAAQEEQVQAQQQLQQIAQGGEIAKQYAEAGQAMQGLQ
ncbi:portal protein [Pseudomonas brassicacearum]|uniref:portal protein n=1 Tax=Pseudomonas brassicacearum TaxID=930166 RepID=UPI0007223C09|nr:portal protein [Pseudomonas brassicacearum]ALQ01483.1 Phage protein [Pseudomonas brassicacearum]